MAEVRDQSATSLTDSGPPGCSGEHNRYVSKQVRGMSDEEYVGLEAEAHGQGLRA